jgi:hypothetical protein
MAKQAKTFGRQAVGRSLVVLKRAPPQSSWKDQAPNPAMPVRLIQSACVLVQ